MPSYRVSGATLLLLTAAGIPLSAQTIRTDPRPAAVPQKSTELPTQIRRGLWFGGGLGYGTLEHGGSIGGATGTLEGGWNLSRRMALGMGTSVWSRGMG